jgi:polysaccharide export outer membrane protein
MKVYSILIALLAVLVAPLARAQQGGVLKKGDLVTIELKAPSEDAGVVTSQYPVSPAGTIRMPMLETEIPAVGISASELARRIEAAYKREQIYTNPSINAFLHQDPATLNHVVIVSGEVKVPGEFGLRQGMTLLAAISRAGGFSDFADKKRVKLFRGNREYVYDLRKIDPKGSNNPLLQDGDQIIVPQD